MKILKKITYKNLLLNKKRTIVTIVGIILSVALITAVSSVYMSGISSLVLFAKNETGDYHLSLKDTTKKDIALLKENRAVESIYLTSELGYAKIPSKNTDKPYARVLAYNDGSLNNLGINLVEGRLPTNETEILITTHLKNNGSVNYAVGDLITLNIGQRVTNDGSSLDISNPYLNNDEKIINAVTKTYKVVGRIKRPASALEPYSSPGYTMISYLSNTENKTITSYIKLNKKGLSDPYKYIANIIDVDENLFKKFYTNQNLTEDEINLLTKELENNKYGLDNINNYLIDLETDPIKASNIIGLGAVVIIILIIIVVTSIFCIKNSFDISITEKNKQYGMLRSVGATKKQIKMSVLYEGFILGLIGIPIGILSGLFAAYILILVSNLLLGGMLTEGLKLVFKVSYISIIIAVLLGIITIYLSSLKSMLRASRVSPISSIRNNKNIKLNSQKVHSPKFIKKLFGIGGTISYKNIKRNKKAYRTTTISLILSVTTFIALFSFMNLGQKSLEKEITLKDYNMSLTIPYEEQNVLKNLTSIEEIKSYSIIRDTGVVLKDVKYNKEYLSFINLDNELFLNNKDTDLKVITVNQEEFTKYLNSLGIYENYNEASILMDYNWFSNDNQDRYLEEFAYKENDKITIELANSKTKDITITKVTNKVPFALKDNNGSILIVSDNIFTSLDVKNEYVTMYMLVDDDSKVTTKIQEQLANISYNVYQVMAFFEHSKNGITPLYQFSNEIII